tara:strand:+ start:634 stop:810 length:177 start_codon:yes stop_codon:yes gene_type:complete
MNLNNKKHNYAPLSIIKNININTSALKEIKIHLIYTNLLPFLLTRVKKPGFYAGTLID